MTDAVPLGVTAYCVSNSNGNAIAMMTRALFGSAIQGQLLRPICFQQLSCYEIKRHLRGDTRDICRIRFHSLFSRIFRAKTHILSKNIF